MSRTFRQLRIPRSALVLVVMIQLAVISACDQQRPSAMTAPSPSSLIVCPIDNPDCNDPPPPPPPFDNSRFGVVTWINWGDNPTLIQDAVDAHVSQVRIGVDWDTMQPDSIGKFDQGVLNAVRKTVRDLKAHNISAFISLAFTPPWARYCRWSDDRSHEVNTLPGHYGEPCPTDHRSPPDPTLYNGWYTFVRGITDSLPEVTDWSVWNEPNSDAFLNVPPGQDPIQAYSLLVAYAADQIHRLPGHRVLGPELALVYDPRAAAGQQDPAGWLYGFLSASGNRIDVVTVHYYGAADPNSVALVMSQYANAMRYMPASVPLWMTEAGPGAGGDIQDSDQAVHLTSVYQKMMSNTIPRWQKTFWFSLYLDNDPTNADLDHTLTKSFGTVRRPAFWCLSGLASGTTVSGLPSYCR